MYISHVQYRYGINIRGDISDIAPLRSMARNLEKFRHEQHCSKDHNNRRNVTGAASDQIGGGMRQNSMATIFRPRGQKSSSGCPSSSRPVLLGCPLPTCQDPSSVFCCLFDWRMTVEWLVFKSLVACPWAAVDKIAQYEGKSCWLY